ncbi:MAG: hypothetical protein D6819_08395 [Gammaproteobacteria bacterium]|nr:MAG: hypothetical protein D6819_08395 [Gammaproteobacteria bacterium]
MSDPLSLFLAGVVAARAGSAVSFPPSPVRQAMERWEALGMKVVRYFKGPGNLVGVALTFPNGKGMIVYVDPDGKTLVSGVALDLATGENLTARAARMYLGEGQKPVPAISAEELGRLGYLQEGSGEAILYAFIDPECPHCLALVPRLKALAKAGRAVVRWVPVGLLGPSSLTKAAYLLGRKDPEDLLAVMETRDVRPLLKDKEAMGRGGVALEEVMTFAEDHGITEVPYLLLVTGGQVLEIEDPHTVESLLKPPSGEER